MHSEMVKLIVVNARQRIAEGDNPTVPAYSVEQLEGAVDALARRVEKGASAFNVNFRITDIPEVQARIGKLADGTAAIMNAAQAVIEDFWKAQKAAEGDAPDHEMSGDLVNALEEAVRVVKETLTPEPPAAAPEPSKES